MDRMMVSCCAWAVVVLFVVGCQSAASREANESFDAAVDEASSAAAREALRTLLREVDAFRITTERYDERVFKSRQDQLVMIVRPGHEAGTSYDLIVPYEDLSRTEGFRFASVVVKPDESPLIWLQPQRELPHEIGVEIQADGEGVLRVHVYAPEFSFVEEYEISEDSVAPVSAEAYVRALAEMRASEAAFDAIGESMGLPSE